MLVRSRKSGRAIEIIGESDQNDPRLVRRPEQGGLGLSGQWSDDFHHAVHSYLTGERRGYYSDYGSAEQIAGALSSPFLFDGKYSPFRGRKHGAAPTGLSGDQFVVCIQNHDQVGNRARGDRLSSILDSPAKRRLAACLLLVAPHLPLIFMGEEYGETNPFPFFCSFAGDELVEAVRVGRRKEFADFVSDTDEIPDPDARQTFESAKLSWSWPEGSGREQLRRLYGDLLHARRRWPAMSDFNHRSAKLHPDENGGGVIEFIRGEASGGGKKAIRIFFNLSAYPRPLPLDSAENVSLIFSSESRQYGGSQTSSDVRRNLDPFECVVIEKCAADPRSLNHA